MPVFHLDHKLADIRIDLAESELHVEEDNVGNLMPRADVAGEEN